MLRTLKYFLSVRSRIMLRINSCSLCLELCLVLIPVHILLTPSPILLLERFLRNKN